MRTRLKNDAEFAKDFRKTVLKYPDKEMVGIFNCMYGKTCMDADTQWHRTEILLQLDLREIDYSEFTHMGCVSNELKAHLKGKKMYRFSQLDIYEITDLLNDYLSRTDQIEKGKVAYVIDYDDEEVRFVRSGNKIEVFSNNLLAQKNSWY